MNQTPEAMLISKTNSEQVGKTKFDPEQDEPLTVVSKPSTSTSTSPVSIETSASSNKSSSSTGSAAYGELVNNVKVFDHL